MPVNDGDRELSKRLYNHIRTQHAMYSTMFASLIASHREKRDKELQEQHGEMAHLIRSLPIGYQHGQDLIRRSGIVPYGATGEYVELPDWLMESASHHNKGGA